MTTLYSSVALVVIAYIFGWVVHLSLTVKSVNLRNVLYTPPVLLFRVLPLFVLWFVVMLGEKANSAMAFVS